MANRDTKPSSKSGSSSRSHSSKHARNSLSGVEALPTTLNCPTCHSVLIAIDVSPGQQVRCGRCSAITKFGQSESLPADKLAWRSFWLGMLSFVLLFITGIPAVYYGIRSLLRMRFTRPKTSDRVAAIIGTGVGGCFGIMFGCMAAIIGVIAIVIALSSERSEDRQVVESKFAECCEVKLPDDMQGNRYRKIHVNTGSQSAYYFSNNEKSEDADLWMKFVHFKASSKMEQSINTMSASAQVFDFRLPKETPTESETLEWSIGGQNVKVYKDVYEKKPANNEDSNSSSTGGEIETIHRYHATFCVDNDVYGFCIVVNVTKRPTTDQEIEAIFLDFKPVVPSDTKHSNDHLTPNEKAIPDDGK